MMASVRATPVQVNQSDQVADSATSLAAEDARHDQNEAEQRTFQHFARPQDSANTDP